MAVSYQPTTIEMHEKGPMDDYPWFTIVERDTTRHNTTRYTTDPRLDLYQDWVRAGSPRHFRTLLRLNPNNTFAYINPQDIQ